MANQSLTFSFGVALQVALQATMFLEDHLSEVIPDIDFDIIVSPFTSEDAQPQVLVTSDSDVSEHLPDFVKLSSVDVPVHYKNNWRSPA